MTSEARIAVLEGRIHRFQLQATVLAAFVVALTVWSVFREVRSFRAVTAAAVPVSISRASLQAWPDKVKNLQVVERLKVGNLIVSDESGEAVVSIGAYEGEARLMVRGSRGVAFHVTANKDLAMVSVYDANGELLLLGDKIELAKWDPAKKREWDNRMDNLGKPGPRLSPDEFAKLSRDRKKPTVSIATSNSGGLVDVFNPFGVPVASIQSDRTNSGAVVVKDVNGTLRNGIFGSN